MRMLADLFERRALKIDNERSEKEGARRGKTGLCDTTELQKHSEIVAVRVDVSECKICGPSLRAE